MIYIQQLDCGRSIQKGRKLRRTDSTKYNKLLNAFWLYYIFSFSMINMFLNKTSKYGLPTVSGIIEPFGNAWLQPTKAITINEPGYK